MKRMQLVVLSVLAFGLQGAGHASSFPADAEASFDLAALETYAERHARMDGIGAMWGVNKREARPHDAVPFGGVCIDD